MIHWTVMLFTLVVLLALLVIAGLDRDLVVPLGAGAVLLVIGAILAMLRPRRREPR